MSAKTGWLEFQRKNTDIEEQKVILQFFLLATKTARVIKM